MMMHVTASSLIGNGLGIDVDDDDTTTLGVAILAVADRVRQRREEFHLPNPLAPVVIRVWDVGFRMSTMKQYVITPEPADSDDLLNDTNDQEESYVDALKSRYNSRYNLKQLVKDNRAVGAFSADELTRRKK